MCLDLPPNFFEKMLLSIGIDTLILRLETNYLIIVLQWPTDYIFWVRHCSSGPPLCYLFEVIVH